MLEALYQNFVVNGFGVEGEQLKRYESGQSKLAGILGLDPDVTMKVKIYNGTAIEPQNMELQISTQPFVAVLAHGKS